MTDKLTQESDKLRDKAIAQKQRLLSGQGNAGYTPIPHFIYRELLPELKAKYDGQTARDCVLLYGYLHAYVNGEADRAAYMWAFPSVKQIREETGIHGDRIAPLIAILESEGVLVTRKVPWNGHAKKMYLPLYERWK